MGACTDRAVSRAPIPPADASHRGDADDHANPAGRRSRSPWWIPMACWLDCSESANHRRPVSRLRGRAEVRAEIFLHHRVLVVPVERSGRPIGVVTRTAFFRQLAERFLART